MMQSNNNLGIERGQCSFYRNVKVKENVVTTISEFVTLIGKGRWRNEVTRYRQLKEEGRLAEAARIKENLPAVVVAGCCEGAHTKANFRKFSGYAVVDVDDIGGDVRAVLKVLEQQPWTYAGWVSVSGKGIKVVVSLMAGTREEYERYAYPEVAACVGRLIGLPVDMQCKDLTRMCYASWDEDAFLKEDCEAFPWREEMERLLAAYEAAEVASVNDGEKAKNLHFIEKNGGVDTVSENVSKAEGMIVRFFRRFCRTHSFVPGSRHDFLLKLGASARRNGMNLDELELLIILAEQTLSAPDYKSGEIRRNITDSYRFTDNNPEEGNPYPGAKVQKGHLAPSTESGDTEERDEEIRERNRQMQMEAPCFPDWIFDALPQLLVDGLRVAKNKRQRDMLLLSMITNLSACMPHLRMVYDDGYVYPHLFLAVVASSASGKGIMGYAARLGRNIQKQFEAAHADKLKEYESAMFSWEQERAKALKEKRTPDAKLKPDPVMRETLIIPADTSRSQLIQLMSGSPHGVLLNTSEFDTLSSAVKAEYGRFDDLMRACFHHEMFGSDFKYDKRSYMVYVPKLAFCGSGTPRQFARLCPDLENGAYSRYMIYMAEHHTDFLSMAPRGDAGNKNKLFDRLSVKVLDMYRYLKAYPTEVFFTPDQWRMHESFFQSALQGVKMEETEGPVSVVFRYGLVAARICMVFTGLRKFEAQWSFRDITCTDDDFLLSLAIMEVLLSHSLSYATSLRRVNETPVEMHKYFRVRRALEKLKSEFTYSELVEALCSEGFSITAAKRCRKRLMEMEVIVKQETKYKFGSRKWRLEFDRNARLWK